jgi:RNA polymerase sigma factor (TIGR02999 family)
MPRSKPEAPPQSVTALLRAWGQGDLQARNELMPLIYEDLRQRALAFLRRERPDHTLQPTALVHETYLRLAGQEHVEWQSRGHFFGIAAQMMRRILVDHARAHGRGKRGGAVLKVTLDDQVAAVDPPECDLLLVDQALTELAAMDPRQARIVELRYFGGLTEAEVADVLDISRSTVTREWRIAKGWLFRRITSGR